MTLNLTKCEFGEALVTYLGNQVGNGQVRPVDAKVAAAADYLAPTTRCGLCRFLGITGYYRCFYRNFSTVVSPLTSLCSPNVPFKWTAECQHAFEAVAVKSLLCSAPVLSAPVLSAPDFLRPFKLEVNASAMDAGAVLLQDGALVILVVCVFFSFTLVVVCLINTHFLFE